MGGLAKRYGHLQTLTAFIMQRHTFEQMCCICAVENIPKAFRCTRIARALRDVTIVERKKKGDCVPQRKELRMLCSRSSKGFRVDSAMNCLFVCVHSAAISSMSLFAVNYWMAVVDVR